MKMNEVMSGPSKLIKLPEGDTISQKELRITTGLAAVITAFVTSQVTRTRVKASKGSVLGFF